MGTGLTTHITLASVREGLIELLTIATKDELFQFNGEVYKPIDGFSMGSPLGPRMANPFMCSIEKLAHENKHPDFHRRYIKGIQNRIEPADSPVQIMLPFRDQKSADTVRRQLCDLENKIDNVLQKVFTSRKISEDLKVMETKPSLITNNTLCMNLNVIFVMQII